MEKENVIVEKANRSHCELFGSIAIFAAKRTSISYQSSFCGAEQVSAQT